MFPWNKWPWTNYHELNLDWIVTRVRELYEWVNRTLKQFTEDLQQETNDRIEADQQLQANIDKEQEAREAADQQLQDNIDAEAEAREAADTQLQNNIDAEEAAREAADTALGERIDKEIQDRTEADTALGQRIDTETSERKAADQQLQSNIDALRSDAILKDGSTTTTAAIPFAQGVKTGSITELSPDAGVSIEAQLDMNSHKITALANGTDNTDAVNVGQLEAFAADVHSIPAGGSSGQVLAKVDGTNYNVTWVDQQGGGSGGDVPAGGTTGQVLAKATDADYQTEWVDVLSSNFKLVQTNDHFDIYASDDGFAIAVGKKLIKPTSLNNINGSPERGYSWQQSFRFTDLSNPDLTIKEEFRIKSPYTETPSYSAGGQTYFAASTFSTEAVQIITNDISTNQQGYLLRTFRVFNLTSFETKTLDEIFSIIENIPVYLLYRYK